MSGRATPDSSAGEGLADPAWTEAVCKASEFVTIIDTNFRIRFINRVQPGLHDVVGTPVFDYVDPRFHETLREAVRAAGEDHRPQHFESEAVGPHGETSIYSNWVTALTGPETDALISITATDITHLRRMEEALEDSRETLRSLVDNAPDYIMLVDREHQIVFVNRIAMGYTVPSVIGSTVESHVPESERAMVHDAIEHVFETGEHERYQIRLEAPDGSYWFSTRLGPILRDGEVVRVTLISTDVTDQVVAEQEQQRLRADLAQAQKMEALGQLTGGIAHDFNNLLTVIGGNLELLGRRSNDPDRVKQSTEAALRGIERAAALTERLLAFSRKQPLQPRATELNGLVRHMEDLLRRTLGATVEIRTSLSPVLHPCLVDAAQLENALLNLALNARDAMSGGGILTISTSNAQTRDAGSYLGGMLAAGDYVRLDVTDRGCGMQAEDLERVFEPFFTTKDRERGSGLGLSMVYGFVTQSGGQVHIESEVDTGTCVSLFLPRAETLVMELEHPTPGPDAEPRGAGELVLVVEDEPQVLETSLRLLRTFGYRTRKAGDAEQALAILESTPDIQLLLTDVILPGGTNGVQLAQRALALRPELPVLYISGFADHAFADAGVSEKTIDFLPKPFTRAELAARVHRALKR
ncbi:MAG: PAS domain-containing protein [Planctomycetota bacterium]|nr:PAS domain-containing protein [Planctomycetota bacterium]